MRIGCDLDDVVYDFIPHFLEYTNMRFGHKDQAMFVDNWNWWECNNIDLKFEEFLQAMDEFTEAGLWADQLLYPDVFMGLKVLKQLGCDIIYMTCRPPAARPQTIECLTNHDLPIDGLIFCDHKEKWSIANSLNINITIEDKIDTVVDYAENHIPVCLRKQPHNAAKWEDIRTKGEYVVKTKGGVDEVRTVVDTSLDFINPVNSFKQFTDYIRTKIECEDSTVSLESS